MRILLAAILALLISLPSVALSQLPTPLGTNHPELTWKEIETEHFRLIYHEELAPMMPDAAKMAEEAYRVVTTNLGTPLPGKTKIYFSDNDAIKNAFALLDDHIFIWMRGILDDHPYGVRSSGTSKWLRSVITHEFTHTVIAYATKGRFSWLFPSVNVPRWFNEGMARYMEPDGWTEDLDMVLRVAAVTGELDLGGPGLWEGTLIYEAGQSLVRHIATTYGDSSLRKIITYGQDHNYKFGKAVEDATGKTLDDIILAWKKRVNVYYNTQFGTKKETEEFGRRFKDGLDIVSSARISRDGKKYAVIGKQSLDDPALLYIYDDDTSGKRRYIELEPGVEGMMSWSSDGKSILLSKMRYGSHGSMLFDLYELDIETENLKRLTTDGHYEDADFSPDGKYIVAVKTRLSGSDLWLLDRNGNEVSQLTSYNSPDVSVYWPRWDPSSSTVAYSLFDEQGRRDIAVVYITHKEVRYFQRDPLNDRYPVWSPDGKRMAFISYRNGVPNVYNESIGSAKPEAVTDVAGGLTVWDWSAEKDSLLVTSVDDRNHVRLYWIAPYPLHDTAGMYDTVRLRPRYTAWRDVQWPKMTRPIDSLPAITMSQPSGYSALGSVQHLITVPLISSDKSRTGDLGIRYGLLNISADPMAKHNFVTFVDWGYESKRWSGSLSYQNNVLRPSLIFNVGSILSYSGIIDNISYFERDENAAIGIVYVQPTPNALDEFFLLLVGGDYRRMLPWNLVQYANTQAERRPIRADIATLGGRLGFVSPDFLTSLTYTHADKAYKSDLTYSRYRIGMSYRIPFTPARESFFAVYGRGLAQFGDELPQQFLGFTPHDVFSGGVNLMLTSMQDRVRGVRKYVYGNRVVIGSAELRTPDNFFKNIFTPLQGFNPQLTYFFDIGSTWYASQPANNHNVTPTELSKTYWYKGAGVELRSELAPGSALSGGVAWELVKRSQPDWYIRAVVEW
jgi:Tol biopolymer transport system component